MFAPAPVEVDPDAESGSAIHAAWCGKPYRELKLDEQETLDRFKALEGDILAAWWKGEDTAIPLREVRLWHKIKNLHKGMLPKSLEASGQADVIYFEGGKSYRALVIDGKRGRKAVTAEPQNRQLRWLAALTHLNYGATEVTVALAQHWSKNNPPCVYNEADLKAAVAEMETDLACIYSPNPKAFPGSPQCDYCKAKHLCPEFLSQSLPMLPKLSEVEVVDVGGLEHAIATLPPEKLGFFLKLVRLAEYTATDEVNRRFASGEKVPGWKKEKDGFTDVIADCQGLWQRFLEKGGTIQQFMACVNVTKKGLRNALAEVTKTRGADLDHIMEECLEGLTVQKPRAGSLKQE